MTQCRPQPGEISIAQLGFQSVEVCTEVVVDRVGRAVQRRGGLRLTRPTGDQCEAKVRVGDHQLIAVAVRDRQRLIEHLPGIGVSVVKVRRETKRAQMEAQAPLVADLLCEPNRLGKTARAALISPPSISR